MSTPKFSFSSQQLAALISMRDLAAEFQRNSSELAIATVQLPLLAGLESAGADWSQRLLPSQILSEPDSVQAGCRCNQEARELHAAMREAHRRVEVRSQQLKLELGRQLDQFIPTLRKTIAASFPLSDGEDRVSTGVGIVSAACAEALDRLELLRGHAPEQRALVCVEICQEFGVELPAEKLEVAA